MPYNFKPLEYQPYETPEGGVSENLGSFQNYMGGQLEGLMGSVNTLGESPFVTGNVFYNTPQYTPYSGMRSDFTTGGQPGWHEVMRENQGSGQIEPVRERYTTPTVFDQKGYLDAQFGHMNDYLSNLGSFFNRLGVDPTQMYMQNIVNNAPGQQAQGPLPTIGGGGLTYGGGTSANNPFPSFGLASGGWGTPPTSLFGAGANATNT